jgi:thiamine-monophosphate kinase
MAGRLDEQGFIDLVAVLAARRRASPGAAAGPLVGIGDDAAVLGPTGGRRLLLATDFLTEGTHFRSAWTPGRFLGRKAVAVNLSDIAAMGGVPHAVVLSVGFPRRTPLRFARAVAAGVAEQARRHGAALVGGDTCAARDLFVSVTILGSVEPDGAVLRSGARPGHGLYVTGRLGAAAAGLALLRRGARAETPARDLPRGRRGPAARRAARSCLGAHLDPVPRVLAGRLLGRSGAAAAMIDLSDGLLQDLPRLCRASRTGAVVEEAAIPVAPEAGALFGARRALRLALAGGEDYELLFAARDADAPALGRLAGRLRLPITRIGQVLPEGQGVRLLTRDGRYLPFGRIGGGFRHFPPPRRRGGRA